MGLYDKEKGVTTKRSLFNMQHSKLFDCFGGELIPVFLQEVIPNDIWELRNQVIVRLQPLVAPILSAINVTIHYFLASSRALWENGGFSDSFESLITRGEDGTDSPTIPTWTPGTNTKGSLWDYFGFPISIDPQGIRPIKLIMNMYNEIYNFYYRDQNVITEKALNQETILNACWEKDYFTAQLPWQQRGTAPAFPISGEVPVSGIGTQNQTYVDTSVTAYETDASASVIYADAIGIDSGSANTNVWLEEDPSNAGYPNVRADLSAGVTFDVSDLRTSVQIQRLFEQSARTGARYNEQMMAIWNTRNIDKRLYKPEYVGGIKFPIITSEVLQTSETNTTPQGTLVGHGISADSSRAGRVHVDEFGYLMGIMCIRPEIMYSSQGINRQFIKETYVDYHNPFFVNLSEREVYRGELYATAVSSENTTVMGYQSIYDELRQAQSTCHNNMRDTLDYWHEARQFSSGPLLNEAFVTCTPRADIFAAPSTEGYIVHCGNNASVLRQLPYKSDPGLLDHVGGYR